MQEHKLIYPADSNQHLWPKAEIRYDCKSCQSSVPSYHCLFPGPGVAASVVGCKGIRSGVDIVKRGEGLITRYPEDGIQRWGDYSALDVFDGVAWFAVPVARNNQPQYGSWIFAEGL